MPPVQDRLHDGAACMQERLTQEPPLRTGEDVRGVPGKRPGPKAAPELGDEWLYRWSTHAGVPQEFYPKRHTYIVKGRRVCERECECVSVCVCACVRVCVYV